MEHHRVTAGEPESYTLNADGVRLAVRVTPRAGRDRLDGVIIGAGGRAALRIRLAARAVDGAANAALITFLAEALSLRKVDVEIVSGETARSKIVQLRGAGEPIRVRLASWIAATATKPSKG